MQSKCACHVKCKKQIQIDHDTKSTMPPKRKPKNNRITASTTRSKKKKPVTRETAVNRYTYRDQLMIVSGPYHDEWWFAEFHDYNWNDMQLARCIPYCSKRTREGEEVYDSNEIVSIMLEDLIPIDRTVVDHVAKAMKFGDSVLKMRDFKWC